MKCEICGKPIEVWIDETGKVRFLAPPKGKELVHEDCEKKEEG